MARRQTDRNQAFNDIFGRPNSLRPNPAATAPPLPPSGHHAHSAGPGLGVAGPRPYPVQGGYAQQQYMQQQPGYQQAYIQQLAPNFPTAGQPRPVSYYGSGAPYMTGSPQLSSIQEQQYDASFDRRASTATATGLAPPSVVPAQVQAHHQPSQPLQQSAPLHPQYHAQQQPLQRAQSLAGIPAGYQPRQQQRQLSAGAGYAYSRPPELGPPSTSASTSRSPYDPTGRAAPALPPSQQPLGLGRSRLSTDSTASGYLPVSLGHPPPPAPPTVSSASSSSNRVPSASASTSRTPSTIATSTSSNKTVPTAPTIADSVSSYDAECATIDFYNDMPSSSASNAKPSLPRTITASSNSPIKSGPKLPSLDIDHEEFDWFASAAASGLIDGDQTANAGNPGKRDSRSQRTTGVDTGSSTPSAGSAGGTSPAYTPASGLSHTSDEQLSPGGHVMERLSDYASTRSFPMSIGSSQVRDYASEMDGYRDSPTSGSDAHSQHSQNHVPPYDNQPRHQSAYDPRHAYHQITEQYSRASIDSDHTSIYQPSASSTYTSPVSFIQPGGHYSQGDGQYGHAGTPGQHQHRYGPPQAGQYYPTQYAAGQHNHTVLTHNSSRRSTESVRVYPTQPKATSAYGDRALSFSGMMDRPVVRPPSHSPHNSSISEIPVPSPNSVVSSNIGPPSTMTRRSHRDSHSGSVAPRRGPVVYPALLSRVADAFKVRITLAERTKDGLSYTDAFDGKEAVDKIAYIIRTSDRNLALLLGRALDAQKFFHDVTYDHRLRDSPNELYQFRERLHSGPFGSNEGSVHRLALGNGLEVPVRRPPSPTDTMLSEDFAVPTGVFTLLTDCYSPTCTRDRLCYSIACPRRLEQQARLNMKLKPGLKKSNSEEGLLGDDDRLGSEPGMLWIHSVPKEVSDSVNDTEKKRQEAINELIYTERDFVRDLEYLRDKWITPLKTGSTLPESRRETFVNQVFWNVMDVHAVNIKLAEALTRRQKSQPIVSSVGDVLLKAIVDFAPFVKYGAHQLYGKYEFEKEKGSNPAFLKFVETTERLPESRKLELNGYLTKPTTRLARYPLLLEVILKITPEGNPDKQNIPRCVKLIRELLAKVNHESGRTEARFNLAQLNQQLIFRPGEAVDLQLGSEQRDLIFKGSLKKRGGTQSESADLQVYLFDHAVLMVKPKASGAGKEQYKVYRKPIPLELLVVSCADEPINMRASTLQPRSLMSRASNSSKLNLSTNGTSRTPEPTSKQGFPILFTHLGRKGYNLTLWSPTHSGRKKWLDKIEQRQLELRERSMVFDTNVLCEGFFVGTNRVICAAPFDGGQQMIYGTDNGVYLANLNSNDKAPVKVISTINVTQVEVLEDFGILVVLADRAVQTFLVDNLDPADAVGAAKRARKISTNASFFKTGVCSNRTLVCIVKSNPTSSTIKTLEPIDPHGRGNKKQPAFRKLLQGNHELLRIYKEFYIAYESSSMHFLKSKLCVGCPHGFEIVNLDTLDTQGLLDPADSSLDFVQKRESARPIAIYRIDSDFLLCYDEFAFYVNKNGWRARSNWHVTWEGSPVSFALHYPYVLAFEPNFIEVRHVESGALMQIIPGWNMRLLFAESPTSSSAAHHAAQALHSYPQHNQSINPYMRQHSGMPEHHNTSPVRNMAMRKQTIFAGDGCIFTIRETS